MLPENCFYFSLFCCTLNGLRNRGATTASFLTGKMDGPKTPACSGCICELLRNSHIVLDFPVLDFLKDPFWFFVIRHHVWIRLCNVVEIPQY